MAKSTETNGTADIGTHETTPKTADNPGDINRSGSNSKKPQGVKKPAESVYSAADLANAARTRFKTAPEVVSAALKMANKTEATLAETQNIIKLFLTKEVK